MMLEDHSQILKAIVGQEYCLETELNDQFLLMQISDTILLLHGISLSQEWSFYASWLLFCIFEHQDVHLSQEWPLYAS